jgi:two-component system sensor histidine kinase PhcS
VYVRADASLLEGVIITLLKNASDALATPRSTAPAIELRAAVGADHVTIEVEDNGPGLREADRARLFDAHVTTRSADDSLGLGLAIVRETIARHGGTMRAESVLGAGTRVIIDLPLVGSPPLTAGPRSERHAGQHTSAIRPSRR